MDIKETSRRTALRHHKMFGGYLVRSGIDAKWVVVNIVIGLINGYRDYDAYGVDLKTVTKRQWEGACWDESKLKGYEE